METLSRKDEEYPGSHFSFCYDRRSGYILVSIRNHDFRKDSHEIRVDYCLEFIDFFLMLQEADFENEKELNELLGEFLEEMSFGSLEMFIEILSALEDLDISPEFHDSRTFNELFARLKKTIVNRLEEYPDKDFLCDSDEGSCSSSESQQEYKA